MTSAPNIPVELSVVVLCYRASDILERFIDQLTQETGSLGISYELVLVAHLEQHDNDPTAELAAALAERDRHLRVISGIKQGGMGWDMRSGLEAARGKYIAVIDGDGQMPASDIPTVYHLIRTGQYDLVKTYRAQRFDGIYRKLLSDMYNFFFRLLYQPTFPVRDVNSKPKIMTREAYQQLHLRSNDWFTDAEIMIQALSLNLRICEVATVFYRNERRQSFVRARTILEFVFNLIKYRFPARNN